MDEYLMLESLTTIFKSLSWRILSISGTSSNL